jgi:hypothetical protein
VLGVSGNRSLNTTEILKYDDQIVTPPDSWGIIPVLRAVSRHTKYRSDLPKAGVYVGRGVEVGDD